MNASLFILQKAFLPQVPNVLQEARFQCGFQTRRLHNNQALKQTNEQTNC